MVDWIELGVVFVLLILILLVLAILIWGALLVLIAFLLNRRDGIVPDPVNHLSRGDLEDSRERTAKDQEEWMRASEDSYYDPLGEEDAKDTADAIAFNMGSWDSEQESRH